MINWPDLKFDAVNLPVIGSDPSLLPDADCENCQYLFHPDDKSISNNHCYMFEVSPGSKCAQFKQVKND